MSELVGDGLPSVAARAIEDALSLVRLDMEVDPPRTGDGAE